MAAKAQRKLSTSSHSIDDYPEHLNPFHEDDNHSRIRFWTVGRKSFRERSSSFSIAGLKDLRSTWSFKSFMKKGRRDSVTPTAPMDSSANSSPIVYRRPLADSAHNGFSRNTVTATPSDRYVYGGSITPLPRSRFQERVSHLEYRSPNSDQSSLQDNSTTPGDLSATKEKRINGSCLSVESTNAFGATPIRASTRKKRRAPLPPPVRKFTSTGNVQILHTSEASDQKNSSLNISKSNEKNESSITDIDINDPSLNVVLKIIEEDDIRQKDKDDKNQSLQVSTNESTSESEIEKKDSNPGTKVHLQIPDIIPDNTNKSECEHQNKPSEDVIDPGDTFHKVNINNYKRQNSIQLAKSTENLEEEVPVAKDPNAVIEHHTTRADEKDTSRTNNNVHSENINHQRIRKTEKINANFSTNEQKIDKIDHTMKDFLDIDKATEELEMEIKKLNEEMETMYDKEPYKRKTVSDIKLIFDNSGDPNTPNPIPKPRRTRLSISSTESNSASPTKEKKLTT